MIIAAALAAVCVGCSSPAKEQGLKDVYADYFKVGVALKPENMNPAEQALTLREFNSVTCENVMKPGEIHPAADVWNFAKADSIADWCRANGIKMRGHCLCWHNQFAMWMLSDEEGNPVSKEVFYERLREHIHTVVGRYKDVIYCWDVVNEAITDDDVAENPFRQSFLYELCGDEFIAKAFEFAAEADPEAVLFYNDYNSFLPGKRDRIAAMVRDMQARGVKINGIGMQGHCNLEVPTAENLSDAIDTFASIVDHVQVTELDIRVNREFGGQLNFSHEGETVSDSIIALHVAQYERFFRVLREHKEQIDVVTFWNLSDKDSWVGTANYPLLFDTELEKKPAYEAVTKF